MGMKTEDGKEGDSERRKAAADKRRREERERVERLNAEAREVEALGIHAAAIMPVSFAGKERATKAVGNAIAGSGVKTKGGAHAVAAMTLATLKTDEELELEEQLKKKAKNPLQPLLDAMERAEQEGMRMSNGMPAEWRPRSILTEIRGAMSETKKQHRLPTPFDY